MRSRRTRIKTAYIGKRIPREGITRRVEVLEAGSLQATLHVDEALDRDDLKNGQVEDMSDAHAIVGVTRLLYWRQRASTKGAGSMSGKAPERYTIGTHVICPTQKCRRRRKELSAWAWVQPEEFPVKKRNGVFATGTVVSCSACGAAYAVVLVGMFERGWGRAIDAWIDTLETTEQLNRKWHPVADGLDEYLAKRGPRRR